MTKQTGQSAGDAPLPDFTNPPVIETAFGVVFLPIEGWKLTHFTRFGRRVEPRYPASEPQDRLITTAVEEFEAPPKPQTVIFEGSAALWWYVDEQHGRLIQLQRDRFVNNWRKSKPTDEYPHYQRTREEFRASWLDFLDFLTSEKLPAPTVLQVELDYVNHIEKGRGWDSTKDLSRVITLLAPPGGDFLPSPEATLLDVRYVMPERKGRLRVTLQPAIRNIDKVELLQMTVGAHGRPMGNDIDSIMSWADVGHEWIVRGFTDVTTSEMHKRWGRIK